MASKYNNVRERLASYRQQKQSQAPIKEPLNADTTPSYLSDPILNTPAPARAVEKDPITTTLPTRTDTQPDDLHSQSSPSNKTSWLILALKALLWLLLFGFFIEIEFGTVFFITSLFYFIYVSLKGGHRRKSWELSAYSVFNRNCERIDGTLSAEQFDSELRYGPTSVR